MFRKVLWPVLLVLFLFAPSLGNGFVYDDETFLVSTPRLLTASPKLAFTADLWGIPQTPTSWRSMHYRPLSMLLFSGLGHVFGLSPFAFHSADILLAAGAVVAVYYLLLGLGFSTAVSFAATLLFAVHPLHSEAICWMSSGTTETLGASLTLTSLAFFANGRRAISIAIAAAAMLSKESALILPVVVFALAYWSASDGRPARTAFSASYPYMLLAAAYLGLRAKFIPPAPPGAMRHVFGLLWHVIPLSLGGYLRLFVKPWPLSINYDLPNPAWTIAALSIAACWVVAVLRMPSWRDDLVPIGILIAIPLALPVLTSPMMGHWLQIQDRYTYMATTGECLLVAVMLDKVSRKTLIYGCLLLVPLGALATHLQLVVWESPETLWTHALEITPDSRIASLNLAEYLYLETRYDEAVKVYRRALIYHPGDKDLTSSLESVLKGHPLPQSQATITP